jgi:hypothetical protein
MKKIVTLVLVSCFASGMAGCMAATPSDADDPLAGLVTHRTVVHQNADGTAQVKVETIPRAQQVAEMKQRAQRLAQADTARAEGLGVAEDAISVDTGCAGSSLWIYDAAVGSQKSGWTYGIFDLTGSENEICFYGAGMASLWDYTHSYNDFSNTTYAWAGKIRSYWPGSEAGYLQWTDDYAHQNEPFGVYGPLVNAGTVGQKAFLVFLTN